MTPESLAEDYLVSLLFPGPRGPAGADGAPGPAGAPGPQGPPGILSPLWSDVDANGFHIGGLPDPVQLGDAATKGWVLAQFVATEPILDAFQLQDSVGVCSACAVVMLDNPAPGDLITLRRTMDERTYGAGVGGNVQYVIGSSPAATMANLADAIAGDGAGIWDAVTTVNLSRLAQTVVVIREKSISGAQSVVWGTWATQANCQVLDCGITFGAPWNYEGTSMTQLPSSVVAPNFGGNRSTFALSDGETHRARSSCTTHAWWADAAIPTWHLVGG